MQPVHSPDSQMLEHPKESQCPGTPSTETDPADKCTTPDRTVNTSPVNSSHVNRTLTSSSPPPCIYTSSVLHVHTVDKNSLIPPPTPNPSTLYDLFSPKLLHQQSLHTAVQQLLHPITHLPSIPIDTLAKLHAILHDSPRLASYLPPLPVARHRPTRAPPVSYADPDQTQIGPPPLSPAFPSCVPAPPPHVPPCSTLPCTRGIFRTSAIMGLGPRVGDAVFGFQEQSRILRRFRAGELNLLISTSGGRASEWVGGRAGGWAAGWLCGCPGHPEGSLTQLDV